MQETISILDVIDFFARRKIVIVTALAIGALLGGLLNLVSPRLFETRTILGFSSGDQQIDDATDFNVQIARLLKNSDSNALFASTFEESLAKRERAFRFFRTKFPDQMAFRKYLYANLAPRLVEGVDPPYLKFSYTLRLYDTGNYQMILVAEENDLSEAFYRATEAALNATVAAANQRDLMQTAEGLKQATAKYNTTVSRFDVVRREALASLSELQLQLLTKLDRMRNKTKRTNLDLVSISHPNLSVLISEQVEDIIRNQANLLETDPTFSKEFLTVLTDINLLKMKESSLLGSFEHGMRDVSEYFRKALRGANAFICELPFVRPKETLELLEPFEQVDKLVGPPLLVWVFSGMFLGFSLTFLVLTVKHITLGKRVRKRG